MKKTFKINIFNKRSLVEVGRFNAKIFVIVSTDLNFFFLWFYTPVLMSSPVSLVLSSTPFCKEMYLGKNNMKVFASNSVDFPLLIVCVLY